MLRFEPYYRCAPWGGRRLADELGRNLPEGSIGESWELSALPQHHSVVAGGPLAGTPLDELWQNGALGGSANGRFPFLLKWLDVMAPLSVQVHPDAEACRTLGSGHAKSECWLVAHADPGATLRIGHYPGLDATTLQQAATGGTILKWMYEMQPRRGDIIAVPAGTLHSIGPGFLLLEVQEPSDTTYRIFDHGRTDRELHLEEAALSVHYQRSGPVVARRNHVHGPCFGLEILAPGATVPAERLRVIVAHGGPVKIQNSTTETALSFGDVGVFQPHEGELRVVSGSCVWLF